MNFGSDVKYRDVPISHELLPIKVASELSSVFEDARRKDSPVLAVVTGTKPDFYKQAPLVKEASNAGLPVFVINTGQHYDETLGFGLKEFNLQDLVGCNLQIRGDLMEKASELILKFGYFGRYCRQNFGTGSLLPVVHGDTLVAGIAPLAWVFGMGQKVGQNEAGLRSMSPTVIRNLKISGPRRKRDIEKLISNQFSGKWFLAREEPFPEQIDTWICSAGTQFFFAPTQLNKDNLIREGYPEEFIYRVGNSVVDAIHERRKVRPSQSIFDIYPMLEKGEWIRVDVHRRENLTKTRFESIVSAIEFLVRNTGYKVVLVMLNAMAAALENYKLRSKLDLLSKEFPDKFIITPVWKEYSHVIQFLDSGHCRAELTDSGSMQEELLYFPNVVSLTLRLNTDRPETIFDAKSNILVPPLSSSWIVSVVCEVLEKTSAFGLVTRNKPKIYGSPGKVSKNIIRVIKKEFVSGDANFFPWLHQRLGLWKENQNLDYM